MTPSIRAPMLIALWLIHVSTTWAFTASGPVSRRGVTLSQVRLSQTLNEKDEDRTSISYEETDASSKGLVSSLTGLVNFLGTDSRDDDDECKQVIVGSNRTMTATTLPPSTPQELLMRIRDDYEVRNYLWTGDIDLAAFDKNCRFTDPTLSFEGTDQFVKNLNNLVPIVNALTRPGDCQSNLLAIRLNQKEGYVQSRWNMVGSLSALPWKPKIDVIGRTKFWYKPATISSREVAKADDDNEDQQDGYRVYFYDEEWEIPAAKALLQLITPPGTIKNG